MDVPIGLLTVDGHTVLLDSEDVPWATGYNWRVYKGGRVFRWQRSPGGKHGPVFLARELLGAERGSFVNHRNGDFLDCRRSNLVMSSYRQKLRLGVVGEDGVGRIPLQRDLVTLVDAEDVEALNAFTWTMSAGGYVVARIAGTQVKLHRYLLRVTDPKVLVDHRDGDPLNNRRSNLRITNAAGNSRNRGIDIRNKTGVTGVSWHKRRQRYIASIGVGRKLIHLGYFDTVEEAATAYDTAARNYHGEFARRQQ